MTRHAPPTCHGDALVIGAGAAGLLAALKLAPRKVLLLAAAPLGEGASSALAQGGVAAAVGAGDSPALHAEDTLNVAAGIADEAVVRLLTDAGPETVEELIRLGARFDRNGEGHLSLGREAAHGRRRILHSSGDATGREITRALVAAVRATPSVQVIENAVAEELLTDGGKVVGARASLDGEELICLAPATLMATGGVGQLYSRTTNPLQAGGEGLGMAARAGAVIADAEFVQFHPTAMDVDLNPVPLLTEALRGEGAKLLDGNGHRFMPDVHEDAELAPRDIVARAIWERRRDTGQVTLDCRGIEDVAARFPTVAEHCRAAGLDLAAQPIPVAPAVHYHMGGIVTDASARSTLDGLWACGEVASTGVHGGNRLASNSLLEALVFAGRAAADIGRLSQHVLPVAATFPLREKKMGEKAKTGADEAALLNDLQRLMYEAAGLVRDEEGLCAALARIAELRRAEDGLSAPLANRLIAAQIIAAAALARRESRGSHFRRDHPSPLAESRRRSYLTLAAAAKMALEIGRDSGLGQNAPETGETERKRSVA